MSAFFVLFLVFLVLKLTHEIDWTWLTVFTPLIAEAAVDLLVLAIAITLTAAGAKSIKR